MVDYLHHKSGWRSKKGFNLIEAAIVLGVVGLVIGGIWWGASSVNENSRVNKLVQETMGIFYKAQELYPRSVDDVFASNDEGASLFVPETWRKSASGFKESNLGHTVSFNINASTHYIRVNIRIPVDDELKGSVCIKITKGLIAALDAVKLDGSVQIVRALSPSNASSYTYQLHSSNYNFDILDSVAQNGCELILFERYF